MNRLLPTVAQAKIYAKNLRTELQSQGETIGHSQSLELIAQRYGYRDWNTLSAAIGDLVPEAWAIGGRVKGQFRGQIFEAQLLSLKRLKPGWYKVSLKLDEPVDVVSFDSFSNFRQRVTAVVGPAGTTREKTSDGQPHLVLDM